MRNHHRTARAAGFSLIEAMVSLVVISVGMIGIAALYGQGLGAGRTALFRTQAVNLAASMADNIRNNRLGQLAWGNAPAAHGCDTGANCTPVQMAEHDTLLWTQLVARQLPNGVGTVVAVPGVGLTPPTFTISVTWNETGVGALTHQIAVQIPPI